MGSDDAGWVSNKENECGTNSVNSTLGRIGAERGLKVFLAPDGVAHGVAVVVYLAPALTQAGHGGLSPPSQAVLCHLTGHLLGSCLSPASCCRRGRSDTACQGHPSLAPRQSPTQSQSSQSWGQLSPPTQQLTGSFSRFSPISRAQSSQRVPGGFITCLGCLQLFRHP